VPGDRYIDVTENGTTGRAAAAGGGGGKRNVYTEVEDDQHMEYRLAFLFRLLDFSHFGFPDLDHGPSRLGTLFGRLSGVRRIRR
jgi:hypothetical protein